jgi:hypothetical protein
MKNTLDIFADEYDEEENYNFTERTMDFLENDSSGDAESIPDDESDHCHRDREYLNYKKNTAKHFQMIKKSQEYSHANNNPCDVNIYSLVDTILPETKVTCGDMRKKSLVRFYEYINEQIKIIELVLTSMDFVTFSCDIKLNTTNIDTSTVKKVKKILKWFYIQKNFMVSFTKEKDILIININWGDFKFLM